MTYVLVGYMWLFIHRPFEVWPALAAMRIEFAYVIFATIAWVASGRFRWVPNPLHLAYAAFGLAVLACWGISPWTAEERAILVVTNYFKMLYFYLMMVTSIRSEQEVKVICLGFLGATGLYMAHSLREFLGGRHVYRMGIPRLIGVDSSLGDANAFGASVVYALPLLLPVWHSLSGRLWRLLAVGYFGLSVLCVAFTGSRSAMVALVAYFGLVVLGNRRARFKVLLLFATTMPVGWFFLPQGLQNRFYSIIDSSVVEEGARKSAEDRGQGLMIGFELLERFPLTGCGPGVWRAATGKLIESHNLYGQVIGEMGLLGLFSFSTIVALLLWNAERIRAAYRDHPWWEVDFIAHLGRAVTFAVILMLVLGYGAHSLFRFNWAWYGAFLIVARDCLDQRLQDPARAEPPARDPEDAPSLEENGAWIPTPS